MTVDDGVTVASLNLHGGRDRDGECFDVAAIVASLSADVILLQETWRPDDDPSSAFVAGSYQQVRHVDLLTTSLSSLGIADGERAPGTWGMALLTNLPVAAYSVLDLGHARGDMSRRAAQTCTITTPLGRRLRIVNVHLSHRPLASPRQLIRLARQLRKSTVPTAVVGDLNMVGPVATAASGFRRALRGATWPAHRPLVQLDHVLLTGRVTCVSGGVLAPVGSDHRPIQVRLTVG